MSEGKKYTTYAIGYKTATPQEEQMAEFALFNAIKGFIETVEMEGGGYIKVLRANIALDPENLEVEKPKSKIIMPDKGLVN